VDRKGLHLRIDPLRGHDAVFDLEFPLQAALAIERRGNASAQIDRVAEYALVPGVDGFDQGVARMSICPA
jgi:hypothetical protein